MEENKEVKQPKKKMNIILFFIIMVIAMLIFDITMDFLYPIIGRMILYGKYGTSAIIEAVCAFIILITLLLFGNYYIFTEKKKGFFKSVWTGGLMLILATLIMVANIVSIFGKGTLNDIGSLAIFCVLIGIFEEFLCRGWIQNEFIERYGNNRKQVYLSILLSALIFGGIHISNIWVAGQSVIDTVVQIINAVGLGFFMGTVYFRTKNIWSVVFLHGFWDFAIFLGEIPVIKSCTQGIPSIGYNITSIISQLLIAGVYICVGFFILRKNKTVGLISEENLPTPELEKAKNNSGYFIGGAIVLYALTILIPQIGIDETCYEFVNKKINFSNLIYSVDKEYTIEENNNKIKLSLTKDNKLLIHNTTTDKKAYFDKQPVFDVLVVKSNNTYKILLATLNDYETDTITYYSEFINLDNITDTEEYLKEIVKSLKKIDKSPSIDKIGYVVSNDTKETYPFIQTDNEDFLVLDDYDVFILKQTDKEKTKKEETPKEETPIETPNQENTPTEEKPSVENQPPQEISPFEDNARIIIEG